MGPGTRQTQTWFRGTSLGTKMSLPPDSALHALRMLAVLRFATPLTQALTVLLVSDRFQVSAPSKPILILLLIESLVAAATQLRLHGSPRVSKPELLLQAHVDIVLFAAMLYFTGGTANPFAPLLVLPVIITSGALQPRGVWCTTISTILCAAFLRGHHVSLSHPQGHTEVFALLQDGIVVNYALTAALLAFFCNRTHAAIRWQIERASDAREAQMRSESVGAIGALAAGSAHELGSPLATMAVLVSELKRAYPSDHRLQGDLQVIEEQIHGCKRILVKMAATGDEQRAESASGARLDEFIHTTIERVRSMNPGATIHTLLDRATTPPQVVAEETLRQAITNVIENAVHASPRRVEITADWSSSDLVVVVLDDGPGVDEEILTNLGKRVAASRKSGLGLGLLLTVATLQRLGGSLDLSNRAAGGTRAQLRVPLAAIVIGNAQAPPNERAHDA